MQENTKQKRTFGEWIEDNAGKISVGIGVIGIAGMWVIYGKSCSKINVICEKEAKTLTAAAIERINALECKECVKAVVTELTGE